MSTDVWLYGFLIALLLFQVVAVPALILKRNDFADVLWGPAFPLTAAGAIFWGRPGGFAELDARALLALGLITVWAIRLFLHVGIRNLSHAHEDVRYNNWRKAWGHTWLWRSYLQVFVLQAVILYIFLTPVLLILASPPQPLGPLALLGVALWVTGFLFEAIADEQLRRFKSNPANKGQLMTQGLWGWSRHPNYFGESVQWWSVWLLATELSYGWLTVIAPIGVTYLLLKVSGVSMLEELMAKRPGFESYKKRTSAFFPRPPKKEMDAT